MSLYAIGDLHLSFQSDKSMEVFGEEWTNHSDKIKRNWLDTVKENDTVVVTGDHSWGKKLEDSMKDLEFIAALPAEYEADVKRVIEESGKTIGIKDYAETWTGYLKSQGYHLYILSNYSQFMLDQTRPGKMPFLKNMDGVIFSCEVQQIKPEADIYETLLSRFGLKPEVSVFLDDRPENCEAARKLGIHVIEFHDLKQAAKELEKLGVK